jgi:hypothetical protein
MDRRDVTISGSEASGVGLALDHGDLDLSSERPEFDDRGPSGRPGLLAGALVAGSVVVALVISAVRGDRPETPIPAKAPMADVVGDALQLATARGSIHATAHQLVEWSESHPASRVAVRAVPPGPTSAHAVHASTSESAKAATSELEPASETPEPASPSSSASPAVAPDIAPDVADATVELGGLPTPPAPDARGDEEDANPDEVSTPDSSDDPEVDSAPPEPETAPVKESGDAIDAPEEAADAATPAGPDASVHDVAT